jgi:hypothetical protein
MTKSEANMSAGNVVSAVGGVTSGSVAEQTLNLLQAQMVRYQTLNGVPPGSVDFKALQHAIDTGDVVSAQAALARLYRDSQSAAPPSQSASPISVPTPSQNEDDGVHGVTIDTTA